MSKCAKCKKPFSRSGADVCLDCAELRRKERNEIQYPSRIAVTKAIKSGLLSHPKKLLCADCGKPAYCYDHRDYTKPLSVDPVCKRCDCLRGAGEPYDGYCNHWADRPQKRIAKQLGVSYARVHKIVAEPTQPVSVE